MRLARQLAVAVIACVASLAAAAPALAVSPRNPYRSFNLSGINYGSMQWERAQQQGKRVWPYYNTPSRTSQRGSTVSAGGFVGGTGGAVVQRSSTQPRRGLFRRR
jgi:hypothetical protein